MNHINKKQIMVILGTRPEAIKLSPIVVALKESAEFNPFVVTTAQHREMLDQVLDLFDIKPDIDFNLMKPDQSLFHITSKAIEGFETVLKENTPDFILVQGDTTTSFIGALAGYYSKIPVGHVEAGLRTFNKYSPFPEEVNRKLVSVIAEYHFAPTESNRKNLLEENISPDRIFITGNTVIDALLMTVDDQFEYELLQSADFEKSILITAHRRENFGQPLIQICESIRQLAMENPKWLFIYPVHLNSNVQTPVKSILDNIFNVRLIPPMDYQTFVNVMAKVDLILTDSGGVQEEAPSLGKPVLVLRNETERPEAVTAGTVKIVGTDKERIVFETHNLLTNPDEYKRMAMAHNPYGDGSASQRIVDIIREKIVVT
jgi:UDP-N-acetylglucosamine 2-epimerase (non-hydrolysing)